MPTRNPLVDAALAGVEAKRLAEEAQLVALSTQASVGGDDNDHDDAVSVASCNKAMTAEMSVHLIQQALSPLRGDGRAAGDAHRQPGFQDPLAHLQGATRMLEEEFKELSSQYAEVMARGAEVEGDDNGESVGSLLELIGKLHAKGQQLSLMKKGMKGKDFRMPVYSPEAIKKKAAALHILQEFREAAASNGDYHR